MQIAERMKSIPFTPIRKIFEEAARREAAGETIIHLELGRPDFDTPAHIKAAAIKALEAGKVHYSSNYGLPELRAAIADKFKRDNNLDYDPATEIIVTVGATEAIFMAMMAHWGRQLLQNFQLRKTTYILKFQVGLKKKFLGFTYLWMVCQFIRKSGNKAMIWNGELGI